jgi:hypothetical protein
MLKKILLYSSGVFLLLFVVYQVFFAPPRRCIFKIKEKVILATVYKGKFEENIPFTGHLIEEDALRKVKAEFDELYWPRVSVGLKASTTINNVDYSFVMIHKDTIVHNGRFEVTLSCADSVWQALEAEKGKQPADAVFRMRLCLSEVANATQFPIGGFYKDSGGKYVYVVLPNGKVVKRDVLLGPHNTECFQVLAGLVAGDVVITSSYERFNDRDNLTWRPSAKCMIRSTTGVKRNFNSDFEA